MYRLRELERRDIKTINSWRNDPELSAKLGGNFRFIAEEVDAAWYDRYLQSRGNAVRCAIVDETDEILGCVYLLNIDHLNQSADFHIMIGDGNSRGKGIGYFATAAMIEHAFYNLNLRRLQLEVLESNTAAQSLYKKVGFQQEGIRRKAIYKNGEFVNELIMGLLREEYIK